MKHHHSYRNSKASFSFHRLTDSFVTSSITLPQESSTSDFVRFVSSTAKPLSSHLRGSMGSVSPSPPSPFQSQQHFTGPGHLWTFGDRIATCPTPWRKCFHSKPKGSRPSLAQLPIKGMICRQWAEGGGIFGVFLH